MTRAVAAGQLQVDDVADAWRSATGAPLVLHMVDNGPAVVDLAVQLGRRSAYDAAYVALAQSLDAELWTHDGSTSS